MTDQPRPGDPAAHNPDNHRPAEDHRVHDAPGTHDPAHPDHPSSRRALSSGGAQQAQPAAGHESDHDRHERERRQREQADKQRASQIGGDAQKEREADKQRADKTAKLAAHARAPHDDEEVPKDALDAQTQGHVEHAEQEAEIAQHNAEAAKERAEHMNEQADEQQAEAGKDERPRDINGNIIVQPGDIKMRSGARNVDMVTTEDDRLVRLKQMVTGHLRNASPDMTGGKGIDDELEPQTGLPKGHVPEGHQDAPSKASPKNAVA
jgi:hypothetical protein